MGIRAWRIAAVVAIGILVAACGNAPAPSAPAATDPSGGWATASAGADGVAFPTEVDGLPVVSIGRAQDLVAAGALDGHDVAIAGFYDEFTPSCPFPGGYIGPLDDWCRFVAFGDTRDGSRLCEPQGGNGIACHQPAGATMSPLILADASGGTFARPASGGPTALVLVGHTADARQWLCAPPTRATCAAAFVVDRVAWAEGHPVPVAVPETGDSHSGRAITPRMTLADVKAAAGTGDAILTAAAFRARDIASVDPRWTMGGDGITWIVRSLGEDAAPAAPEARSVNVQLVDDATGDVIDSHPLPLDAAYQPAWVTGAVTVHGLGCCDGSVAPFSRVETPAGVIVSEDLVGTGSSGDDDVTTFGGGYGSTPLVLEPGDYRVEAWLATSDGGPVVPARARCGIAVTVGPLDAVVIAGDIPVSGPCTMTTAPWKAPSP